MTTVVLVGTAITSRIRAESELVGAVALLTIWKYRTAAFLLVTLRLYTAPAVAFTNPALAAPRFVADNVKAGANDCRIAALSEIHSLYDSKDAVVSIDWRRASITAKAAAAAADPEAKLAIIFPWGDS